MTALQDTRLRRAGQRRSERRDGDVASTNVENQMKAWSMSMMVFRISWKQARLKKTTKQRHYFI